MIKLCLLIKNFFKIGLFIIFLSMPLSMSAWATDSSGFQPPSTTPAATYLLTTGFWHSVYAGMNAGPAEPPVTMTLDSQYKCPTGFKPLYNVAVRQGFKTSGDANSGNIRGYHLHVSDFGVNSSKQIFITFDEAYVDVSGGEDDKPLDISYWFYCEPST